MPQLTLKPDVHKSVESDDAQLIGDMMRPDPSRVFVGGPIGLTAPDITIRCGVKIRAKRTLVGSGKNLRPTMLNAALHVFARQLEQRSQWDIFQSHEINLDYWTETVNAAPLTDESDSLSLDVTVSDALIEHLKPQAETDRQVRNAFDQAVRRLRELAESVPRYDQSETRDLWHFVELCLDCGEVGRNYLWYREKRADISSSFNELLRRKRVNHPGYQLAQRRIQAALYSFEPPLFWTRLPPSLHSVSKYLSENVS